MAEDILYIAPTTPVAETIRSVLDAQGLVYPVHEATMSDAADLALSYVNRGTKIVVSYGGTANLLRKTVPAHVIEIRYSSFDLTRVVHAAANHSRRIAIVGFESFIYNARQIEHMFPYPLCIRQVHATDEIPPVIEQLGKEGIEVFVGGSLVVNAAKRFGYMGVYIDSDRRAVEDVIEESRWALRLKKREEERFGAAKAVLNSMSEGLVGIDRQGVINEVNRVAVRLIGIPTKELLGTPIANLIPNRVMVDDTLANGSEWFGEPVTIAGSLYSVNCVPVTVDGDTHGAVLTLQEPQQVQSMEQKMRKVYRSEGHTARRTLDDVIGESAVMRSVREQARVFSQVDSTILIYGETGTGKELIAQGLHNASTRAANPFVAINCAALPESLLESELFGYVRGAFTGARSNGKMGLFEIANAGTIFLDEIGEMALPLQSRLLRVLEEKEIWRIGDTRTTPVDIRVVAATNRDLARQVQLGEFREDLYYRLSVLILNLPPLRQRKDDLRLLANHILAQKSAALGRPAALLDGASAALLETLDWPGNIRQLSNVLERAVVLSRDGGVEHRVLAEALESCSRFSSESVKERQAVTPPAAIGNELEKAASDTIRRVLADCAGNKKQAAKLLGISHTTLWRRLKELDVT